MLTQFTGSLVMLSSTRLLLITLAAAVTLTTAACSRKSAEEKGAELASEKIDMAKGIGGVLEEKGSAAAESLTTGMGNVVKGVGKGMEKSGRVIAAKPSVEQAGLKVTKLQDATLNAEATVHGLEAYIVANADAHGKLRVIAYDLLDNEIGRTRIDLVRTADEGKYVSIPLDAQVNLASIAKVEFDFLPDAPSAK
jgi:hypothetical protein